MVIKSVSNPEIVKDTIWQMHLNAGGGSHIVYTHPLHHESDSVSSSGESGNDVDGQEEEK